MINPLALFRYRKSLNSGFTLIEVLTVFTITTFIAVSLLTSIIRAKPNFTEAAQVLMSDIRMVQANALASKQYRDPATGASSYRCGYGLSHPNGNDDEYFLYAGRLFNGAGNCPASKTYSNENNTPTIFTRTLDSRLELVTNGQLRDIYFQSPDGRVFINSNDCPVGGGSGKSQIIIRKKGVSCPSADCIYVCVYAFGRIESRTDDCPNIAC
ncbi:MAG: type II secretion system protein [bacterium]|nr:type II secretion system protein [bacterium]